MSAVKGFFEGKRTRSGPHYVCDECHSKVFVGDWPFCKGSASDHKPGGKFGHTPFAEYLDPHILPYSDPRARETGYVPGLGREVMGTRITSREQRRKLMKENNLDFAPRPMGEGGTEF